MSEFSPFSYYERALQQLLITAKQAYNEEENKKDFQNVRLQGSKLSTMHLTNLAYLYNYME